MRVWLHIAAAVFLVLRVASASSAETAVSDDGAVPKTDYPRFSAISIAPGSYRSVTRSKAAADTSSSSTRILPGHYEFDHALWRLKSYSGANSFGVAGSNDKRIDYPSADWAANRNSGTTSSLRQMPLASLDNSASMGWTTRLGLAPPITSTIGIPYDTPSDIQRRGFMFGANYHF